jgi:hypothetical protein
MSEYISDSENSDFEDDFLSKKYLHILDSCNPDNQDIFNKLIKEDDICEIAILMKQIKQERMLIDDVDYYRIFTYAKITEIIEEYDFWNPTRKQALCDIAESMLDILKNDIDFMMMIIARSPKVSFYLSDELKNDKVFMYNLLQKNPIAYGFAEPVGSIFWCNKLYQEEDIKNIFR